MMAAFLEEWEIGQYGFATLEDGTGVSKWYIVGKTSGRPEWGGFDTEVQAIEFLLDYVKKNEKYY